jgi:hypothetical protein
MVSQACAIIKRTTDPFRSHQSAHKPSASRKAASHTLRRAPRRPSTSSKPSRVCARLHYSRIQFINAPQSSHDKHSHRKTWATSATTSPRPSPSILRATIADAHASVCRLAASVIATEGHLVICACCFLWRRMVFGLMQNIILPVFYHLQVLLPGLRSCL